MFNKQFFNQLGFIQTDIFEIVPSHIYVTDSPYENLKKKTITNSQITSYNELDWP